MARVSQTRLAVLGALSVRPMTGYAVRAAITDTLGHFWSESFGQIYPALAGLEAEGLVRRTGVGATSGAVFALTPSGQRTLRGLLAEPFVPAPPRNGLLLRLFFGRQLGVEACRELLTEALNRTRTAAAQLERVRSESTYEDPTPDQPYWLMTLSAGEHATRAQLAWLEESIAALDALGE
jgi:DNA-binding PadR family transcriptional regulator